MTQRTVKCPWCGADVEVPQETTTPHDSERSSSESVDGQALPQLAPGTEIMALWSNGTWYPGVAEEVRGDLCFVAFEDGEKRWAERREVAAQSDPPAAEAESWQPGMKVRGRWVDGRWYPGEIDRRFGQVWHVAFDDGDQAWLAPDRIRSTDRSIVKGPRAMARWNDGKWYQGVIDQERHGLAHLSFDDGDEMWTESDKVVRESDPADDQNGRLSVGAKVTARWSDGRWYGGVLDDRFGPIWHIKYDDGDEAWLTAAKIQPR